MQEVGQWRESGGKEDHRAGSPYLACHISYSRILRVPHEFILMRLYTEDPHCWGLLGVPELEIQLELGWLWFSEREITSCSLLWPSAHWFPVMAQCTLVPCYGPVRAGSLLWPSAHWFPVMAQCTLVPCCGPVHTGSLLWPSAHWFPVMAQ